MSMRAFCDRDTCQQARDQAQQSEAVGLRLYGACLPWYAGQAHMSL